MATKHYAWLAGCLFGAACTLGPDFVQPSAPTPASWVRDGQKLDAQQVAPGQALDISWWRALNDPLLNTLIAQVADANLDVKTATVRLEQSRAERGVAAADLYPHVEGSANYTREKESDKGIISLLSGAGGGAGSGGASGGGASSTSGIPSTSKSPPFNLYQYGFDASWELDIWGRVRRGVEAADAGVEASEQDRRGTTLSVIAELVRDYVQLRGTQADLGIARDGLRTAEESARLTDELYRGGLGNAVDVANAKAQAASTAAQIPPLMQQQASLMNAMALLLAQPPGALDAMLTPPQAVPVNRAPVPIGVPSQLLSRRPDIREAEAQLHAATAQIGVAKANFFPQVTLMGNGALQALELRDLNSWAARTYGFGPSVTLPIFEGGQLTSTLELRNAQEREAALTYQKTVLNAFHEVDNALTSYRSEQQRLAQLRVAARESKQAFALARERYKKGLGNYFDVLSAERDMLQTQQQTVASTQNVTVAMVQLCKALGGGWEIAFPEKSSAHAASTVAGQ